MKKNHRQVYAYVLCCFFCFFFTSMQSKRGHIAVTAEVIDYKEKKALHYIYADIITSMVM